MTPLPPYLDREAIEARKAAFGPIARYADPEILPMPEVTYFINGRMKRAKPLKSAALTRIVKVCKRPDRRRGKAPVNKVTAMTGRAMLDLLRAGRSMAQIAVAFQVTRSAASKALAREVASSEELTLEYEAMLRCRCGRPKLPQKGNCRGCRWGRKKA